MNTFNQNRDQKQIEQNRVLAAIKLYQSKHHGLSPANHMIAREVNLSPGQVGYHIRQLENQGKLFIANDWPRQIIFPKGEEAVDESPRPKNEAKVFPPATVDVVEADTATLVPFDFAAAKGKKLPYDARKVQIAHAIEAETKRLRHPPSVKEIAILVFGQQGSGTGNTTRLIKKMVEDGLVRHRKGHHADLRLTALGQKLLANKEAITEAAEAASDKRVRKTFYDRATEIAKVIAANEALGRKSGVKELAEVIYNSNHTGLTSKMIGKMLEEGWINHRPNHQQDITLTAKGRVALLGEEPVPVQIEQEISDAAREEAKEAEREATMPELREAHEQDEEVPEPTPELRELMSGEDLAPWEPMLTDKERAHYDQLKREIEPQIEEAARSRTTPATAMVPVDVGAVLSATSDLDLVLELASRGYRVTRQ